MPETIATVLMVVAALILSAIVVFYSKQLKAEAVKTFDKVITMFGGANSAIDDANGTATGN